MIPQLNLIFLHSERIGYGVQGLETFAAMQRLGADVYDGLPGSGDLDLHKKRAKICKDVLFLSTPAHVPGWYEGQRAHLFTMWETMKLPELLKASISSFETILTCSKTCVELYSEVHPNVKYIPLGVDSSRWAFRERRESPFFDFLVAGSGKRKGADLVHRAFTELFLDGDNRHMSVVGFDRPIPRLTIKTPNYEEYSGTNVTTVTGWLPPEDEVELYASAHCYVQPSRGEGWGLQPLQAMSQGCPTILTNAHGHQPFARFGFPIDSRPAPTEKMNLFGDSGDWWEPDYQQLKAAMWHVYENYASHRDRARRNASMVRNLFTWEKSALSILNAIGYDKLCERFAYTDIPTRWISPKAEKFRVQVNRDYRADLGGIVQLFQPGQPYSERADLKRLLFEMAVLHPDSGSEGLSETQRRRWDEYVADQEEIVV